MTKGATVDKMPNKDEFSAKRFMASDHHRSFLVERDGAIDQESRTVNVAFSSEEPYLRWFGFEILGHRSEEVRLGRLENSGAVLLDHDHRDIVGVVESVSIGGDRVGRASLRFGRSAKAEEVFNDVVDGIRVHISVGYRVHDMILEEERRGEEPVYRVNDWEPFEVSFVSVPADDTVGVGRSVESETSKGVPAMETENQVEEQTRSHSPAPAAPAVQTEVDVTSVKNDARRDELVRIREITSCGKQFGYDELAEKAVNDNTSVDQFRQIVLAKMAEDQENVGAVPSIGLSQSEARQFSFTRAMASLVSPDSRQLREAAAFEYEVSEAAQAASGRRSFGIMVPPDVSMQRDLTVGTDTAGGHTVATELGSLIDMLRNRSVIAQVGAEMITGLEGNVAFPRQTGGGTGYWVAEGGAPTESQQSFDQVPLSPKTYGAFTEYTRQLLMQSSIDVEAFVRRDLSRVLALGIDLAALYGTGASNQPTGVSNQTGINTPTNFAAANPTFAEVVDMETQVAIDNADVGALAYVARTDMRGHFKTTEKFSSTGQTIWESGNTVNGYNCGVSNQVTAGDLFFGNWAELIIGMWGGLDLMVNPYALDTSGGYRVVALQSVDMAVRHPVSFAFNNDGV